MDDHISRRAAIEALKRAEALTRAFGYHNVIENVIETIRELPSAEPTLYGYKIEHLAYIATVMEKEGVTAEYAVRTFDDMERVIKMVIEEAREKIEEALFK